MDPNLDSKQQQDMFGSPSGSYNLVGVNGRTRPGLVSMWDHTIADRVPWAVQSMHSSPVMPFTGNVYSSKKYTRTCDIPTCSQRIGKPKRRVCELGPSSHDGDDPPAKQFASAEKMAERMRCLQISSDLMNPRERAQRELNEIDNRLMDDIDFDEDEHPSPGHEAEQPKVKLELTPDIKNWRLQSDILPRKIIEDISRPSLEVVLWKPPGNFVREVVRRRKQKSDTSMAVDEAVDTQTPYFSSCFNTLRVDRRTAFLAQDTQHPVSHRMHVAVASTDDDISDKFDSIDDDIDL